MTNLVPVSRIYESCLTVNGKRTVTVGWSEDPAKAHDDWEKSRLKMLESYGQDPGEYQFSGLMLDAATGALVDEFESSFVIPHPLDSKRESRRGISRQVALAVVSIPAIVCGLAALVPVGLLLGFLQLAVWIDESKD